MKNFLKHLNIKKLKNTVDEITVYSSAMSFYTIFSLIPIILLVLSIFSSTPFFNSFYEKLQNFLIANILPSNQEQIKTYLNAFMTNSSKMGLIGGVYIIITSILFFDNYETIISKIFRQDKRNMWEKLKLYWTMLTLFPVLFSIAIYLSIKLEFFLHVSFGFLVPFGIIWLTFFLAYVLTLSIKSIKITLKISFIVTGLFFIAKNIFLYYVIFNKTYTTIYGSLSILLFLFLWIYINWIIYISGIYVIKFLEDKMLQNFTKKDE